MPFGSVVSKVDGKETEVYTVPDDDSEAQVGGLLDAVFALSAVAYFQFRHHFLSLDDQVRGRS